MVISFFGPELRSIGVVHVSKQIRGFSTAVVQNIANRGHNISAASGVSQGLLVAEVFGRNQIAWGE